MIDQYGRTIDYHRITSYRPKLRPGISPGVFAGAHGPQQRPAAKFSKVDLYYSRYFLKIQTPFRGWRRAAQYEKRPWLVGLFQEKEMPAVV